MIAHPFAGQADGPRGPRLHGFAPEARRQKRDHGFTVGSLAPPKSATGAEK